MDRFFIRNKDAALKEKQGRTNIAVVGLGQDVGTTLVASCLAFYFAENGEDSTYIECITPSETDRLLYDATAMNSRFVGRTFHSLYQMIRDGEPIRNKRNMEMGVNWILAVPADCQRKNDLTQQEKARLIGGAKGDVRIFDMKLGGGWEEFLMDMDVVVVIVDPLPSKMIRNSEKYNVLKKLELAGSRIEWVVNKVNRGVNKRQVRGYLKTSNLLWIDEFPLDEFYADEFRCRFHWENQEIYGRLSAIFTKVSH